MAFATNNSTDNTFTIKKMLQQEDVLDFIQAMMKEIDDHESHNHWSLVWWSSLPPGAKKIMSIWSFKRKRLPDGRIIQHIEI